MRRTLEVLYLQHIRGQQSHYVALLALDRSADQLDIRFINDFGNEGYIDALSTLAELLHLHAMHGGATAFIESLAHDVLPSSIRVTGVQLVHDPEYIDELEKRLLHGSTLLTTERTPVGVLCSDFIRSTRASAVRMAVVRQSVRVAAAVLLVVTTFSAVAAWRSYWVTHTRCEAQELLRQDNRFLHVPLTTQDSIDLQLSRLSAPVSFEVRRIRRLQQQQVVTAAQKKFYAPQQMLYLPEPTMIVSDVITAPPLADGTVTLPDETSLPDRPQSTRVRRILRAFAAPFRLMVHTIAE